MHVEMRPHDVQWVGGCSRLEKKKTDRTWRFCDGDVNVVDIQECVGGNARGHGGGAEERAWEGSRTFVRARGRSRNRSMIKKHRREAYVHMCVCERTKEERERDDDTKNERQRTKHTNKGRDQETVHTRAKQSATHTSAHTTRGGTSRTARLCNNTHSRANDHKSDSQQVTRHGTGASVRWINHSGARESIAVPPGARGRRREEGGRGRKHPLLLLFRVLHHAEADEVHDISTQQAERHTTLARCPREPTDGAHPRSATPLCSLVDAKSTTPLRMMIFLHPHRPTLAPRARITCRTRCVASRPFWMFVEGVWNLGGSVRLSLSLSISVSPSSLLLALFLSAPCLSIEIAATR